MTVRGQRDSTEEAANVSCPADTLTLRKHGFQWFVNHYFGIRKDLQCKASPFNCNQLLLRMSRSRTETIRRPLALDVALTSYIPQIRYHASFKVISRLWLDAGIGDYPIATASQASLVEPPY